ncbi:peptidoglycan-binding protein [Streptomyces atroolivaceus]|uniref:Peptidoglycan-binding protein n=1 Tax=Streptomyces atroolivaceus TaxID=66869 RepID=A0ABV9V7D2_STRAZ|nr:peptidoglycan-binding protein [Streptomyces atroolivaceus]
MTTQHETRHDTYYIVRKGDTLSAIARRYDTTVKQLQIWNHIADVDVIHPGQRLIVAKHDDFVPFPGKDWFAGMPNSPIILMMAYRLIDEGCNSYPDNVEGVSPRWDEDHRNSYAKWQRKLGYSGSDANGVPGRTSWDKLRVPFPD